MGLFDGVETCIGDDCDVVWQKNNDRGVEVGEFQTTGGVHTAYFVFRIILDGPILTGGLTTHGRRQQFLLMSQRVTTIQIVLCSLLMKVSQQHWAVSIVMMEIRKCSLSTMA
jgi:hypothetical protein